MAANSGANVLRYSALVTGIAYGLYHQSSIYSSTRKHEIEAKYEHQSSLIQKAKAEWTKKTLPPQKKTDDGEVISNPEDPKFDLEAYLTVQMAESGTK